MEMCREDGCQRKAYRRGVCQTHYRKQGDPRYHRRSWQERFWSKVKRGSPSECWGWTGALIGGYGVLRFPEGNRYAHRLSWELHYGPIPPGMTIDHYYAAGCREKSCVNPEHLRLLTRSQNAREGAQRQNQNPGDTCKRGHLDWGTRGNRRYCRECQRQAWRRFDAKRRSAST